MAIADLKINFVSLLFKYVKLKSYFVEMFKIVKMILLFQFILNFPNLNIYESLLNLEVHSIKDDIFEILI